MAASNACSSKTLSHFNTLALFQKHRYTHTGLWLQDKAEPKKDLLIWSSVKQKLSGCFPLPILLQRLDIYYCLFKAQEFYFLTFIINLSPTLSVIVFVTVPWIRSKFHAILFKRIGWNWMWYCNNDLANAVKHHNCMSILAHRASIKMFQNHVCLSNCIYCLW